MRSYLLTGEYYTAPDRGSPDGNWCPIEHHFSAEADSAAAIETKRYLEEEYSYFSRGQEGFRDLRLMHYEEVDLAPILG